jgi:hypothetical protein
MLISYKDVNACKMVVTTGLTKSLAPSNELVTAGFFLNESGGAVAPTMN